MKKNDKGFSLIIVAIFMSIAALFIGYLLGSWLISFLVEDNSTEVAEPNKENVSQQFDQKENNLTAPTAAEKKIAPEQNNEQLVNSDSTANNNLAEDNSTTAAAKTRGNYGVQIGAFTNYNNALSVKNKVEKMGYDLVITESSPHQVKVIGYKNRTAAEAAAAELKSAGYNGFIVVLE